MPWGNGRMESSVLYQCLKKIIMGKIVEIS